MLSIDTGFTTRALQDLVRINSVNPILDPSAPGEREVARYVGRAMAAIGAEVHYHEPKPGRVSVVARLRGSRPGRSLMFNAHVDTVDVAGMDAPFSGEVRDGRVYGRGAFDMKGGLAAMMGAVKALADAGCPHGGEILLAAVADEEYASLGTEDLVTRYRPDAAIVTEPTGLDICLAHKGFAWFEVTTRGRAAHGSRFDLGVDANMRMGRVLADLDALEQDLRARPPHRLVGPPSLHAATIAGGSGLSTYAASCRLQIERRTIPGERRGAVADEIRTTPAAAGRARPVLRGGLRGAARPRAVRGRGRRGDCPRPDARRRRPCWDAGRRTSGRRRGWTPRCSPPRAPKPS